MSHNIFLMLQACNKFREYQARELLIELLEDQLVQRRELVQELKSGIEKANILLSEE
jgi:MED7 protein